MTEEMKVAVFQPYLDKFETDVMRLYCRYLDYIYSESVSDEDLSALNSKMRNLSAESKPHCRKSYAAD